MGQLVMKKVKNEKGLTLIELLAVVVILGIIAAIAIPAIGGLIDNSKKDAHAANATQMINSAKLAVVGDDTLRPAAGKSKYVSLKWLEENGHIEPIKDPDGDLTSYSKGTTGVTDTKSAGSGVQITASADGKTFTYAVRLINSTRGVQDATKGFVPEKDVKRSSVVNGAADTTP